jgi:glycosyltransferase involved in cell wall biosynthesis
MKISILIPTYNRRDMVCGAIRKILSLTPRAFHEIVVSDNHSTDGTEAALRREFGDKIIYTRPTQPVPPYQNWRHAFQQASGTHVHFHWSDDWLEDNFYAHAQARHEQTGANVVVTSVRVCFKDGFNPIYYSQESDRRLSPKKALRRFLLEEGRCLPRSPMAYILPAEAVREFWFESLPPMDRHDPLQLAIGPDALLVAGCLLREKVSLEILPGPDVCFRNHAESISVTNEELLVLYGHCYRYFAERYELGKISEVLAEKCGRGSRRISWSKKLLGLISPR